MTRLSGSIPAVATPLLRGTSEVDEGRLIAHCRRLIELGADGVNLLGTTGEAASLSIAQRLAVMAAVARSGLPLRRFMVGTGVTALADTVRLTQAAADLGFGGALVLPPFFFKGLSDDELAGYFAALIERASRPALRVYLYHIPQNTGVGFSSALIGRLRERWPEIVVGLKDSSGDLAHAAKIANEHPGFDVLPSAEAAISDVVSGRFAGVISATLNVTLPLVARGADHASIDAAVAIRAALSTLPLVPAVKWALADLTGDPAWAAPLPPFAPLARERAARLAAALAGTRYGELAARFR